ncbi:hypothetical protein [Anaerocolumna jejuensis]|uniref:hypothetical protein n=1 Tax=Anaerocolumna jejuensis TaxID=259063 RepID=UPI003F7CA4D9
MKNNTNTITADDNIVISHLTGHLTIADVDTWYEEFEKVCFGFIDSGRPFRLLMNRNPYTVSDIHVRPYWRQKFFNEKITSSYEAFALVLSDAEIVKAYKENNQYDYVDFFLDYDKAFIWLKNYKRK